MTGSGVLEISPELALPLDAVTSTFAILAVKGAGKSNAAVVFAEELYDHDLPWVAVDPKGDWWGIRAAGDGKREGLSVVVFGGEHADVPLEPSAGRYIADLVAQQRLTCVLDVSELTKADMRRFLTDFAERLYRRNREPLMIFCEEADEYIPQMVRGEAAKTVGAFETLVKRGRFRGIGVTLITQRSASLNKDVLTQADTLIAMRTPSPQDRKAVLAWIDHHAASKDVVDELPALQAGEAWVFSPAWLRTLSKIRFRRRRTFDSGATPTVGGKPRPSVRLADVDLAAIKEAMAETIERAEATDPRKLQARVRELEAELARTTSRVEQVPVEVPVEIAVLTDADRELLARVHAQMETAHAELSGLRATLVERLPAGAKEGSADALPPVARATPAVVPTGDVKLGKAERSVLTVLASFPQGRNRRQLAALAQLRAGGGHFGNVLSRLRTNGLIVGEGQGPYVITDAGVAALGDSFEPLPKGQALLDWWLEQLGRAHRDVLLQLVQAYPESIDRSRLAELVGVDHSGGHYGNVLSQLRTRDLIVGSSTLRADDDFMAAINA